MPDERIETEGLVSLNRLQMIFHLSNFRPDLLPELQAIVFTATEPDTTEWDVDNIRTWPRTAFKDHQSIRQL